MKHMKKLLIILGIPTLYAVVLRVLFGIDDWEKLFSVMSITFLFCLPTILGALTVFLSGRDKAASASYRIFAPWVPIFFFLLITISLSLEGWVCWIMILPVFLVAASLGGLLGGYLKMRSNRDKLNMSALLLLPFLIGPLESQFERKERIFEAYTFIDIATTPERIWPEVTRVREISEAEDSGWLSRNMGLPRPVKAELNYEGVGAYRAAIFTGGLVFHETVTRYEHQKLMEFDIVAKPHEIPATTLDEHILIGGEYFNVISGKYELEDLGNGTQRLHLSSRFVMRTHFNRYAGLWGRWIMKDIQMNILRVEKKRAQG
jgi:hypothetical protein